MMDTLHRAIERLSRRLQHMVRVGIVTGSDDAGPAQVLQLKFSDLEQRDHTRVINLHGFTSRPMANTNAVVLFLTGDRSQGLVLGTNHQNQRMRDLKEGEVAVYDDKKRRMYFTRDGVVLDGAVDDINVKTDTNVVVTVKQEIHLLGDGETLRRLVTDVFQGLFNNHTHGGIEPGGGTTGVPTSPLTDAHLTGATRAGGP